MPLFQRHPQQCSGPPERRLSCQRLPRWSGEAQKAGLKIDKKKTEDYEVPEELIRKFEEDPDYQVAFEALTPGRQRGYLLHFAGAKQSATREARIAKCREKIFAGKGFMD